MYLSNIFFNPIQIIKYTYLSDVESRYAVYTDFSTNCAKVISAAVWRCASESDWMASTYVLLSF